MHIIDRRLNPSGKSAGNRQRFLQRTKAHVEKAVRESSKTRDISDIASGGSISISLDGISEPTFHHGATGVIDSVLPGNDRFAEGDLIPRPPQGSASGSGSGTGGDADEDAFRFVLSSEEFVNLFMSDLELPDMVKKQAINVDRDGLRRAGYTVSGSPANMSVARTMRIAMSRRIALGRPKANEVEDLRDACELAGDDGMVAELEAMQAKMRRIPYIDPIDVRYRHFEPHPKPAAQAVMFCLMDVSGSMSEHKKDLAKRFYMLLYIFLTKHYQRVKIVFIRHTDEAREVDERTFFYDTETGGTVVSSALEVMQGLISDRFSPHAGNI